MNDKLQNKAIEDLFDAVLSLETKEECYAFFEDLCTGPELKSISQRFQVAKMLEEHHVFKDIAGTTGASTATISRVNRSLNYGSNGYKTVLNKMKEKKK